MTPENIKTLIRCGETSDIQFKQDFRTAEDIANELVAFSNSEGGTILIGVNDKTGEISGLEYTALQRLGTLVASASSNGVHPVVYPIVKTVLVGNDAVMSVCVPKGEHPPYTNNKGEVFVKQGPDKRRVTDRDEILRLFSKAGYYQPDRQPIAGTSVSDIDTKALEQYFKRSLGKSTDALEIPLENALQNLFILSADGQLTLGGLMFFGKEPQHFCPAFNIKAVWFYGNSIGGSEYRDSKDIDGTIPEMFEDGMRFLESCLHRRQAGQNFNSTGILEVSEVALRELLQNSLVHRSWLKPAPVRLLIFDNRVEIISPGALPDNLTVDDIKLGNAYQRNQLIATLCSKTMDYRGLGSGIVRALQSDSRIDLYNESSGNQFRVVIWRDEPKSREKSREKGREKSREKIIELMSENPYITSKELQKSMGVSHSWVERLIKILKSEGKIMRIGPDKGGYWEVVK